MYRCLIIVPPPPVPVVVLLTKCHGWPELSPATLAVNNLNTRSNWSSTLYLHTYTPVKRKPPNHLIVGTEPCQATSGHNDKLLCGYLVPSYIYIFPCNCHKCSYFAWTWPGFTLSSSKYSQCWKGLERQTKQFKTNKSWQRQHGGKSFALQDGCWGCCWSRQEGCSYYWNYR